MNAVFCKHEVILQSVVKPHNNVADNGQERPNEDYAECIKLSDDSSTCVLGLADGAGGYGVFASEWAKALVQRLPVEPMKSAKDIDNWLNSWWEGFYEQSEKKIPAENTILKNIFYKEGSAATLCALWLFADKEGSPYWNSLCYGDSVIFRFNTASGQLEVPAHLQTAQQWEALPNLINWVNLNTSDTQISVACGNLLPDECWLLASDALAQWIWVQYLIADGSEKSLVWLEEAKKMSGKLQQIIEVISQNKEQQPFSEWLEKLLQASLSETTFKKLLYNAYEQKQLMRDDYTLLILRPATMTTAVQTVEHVEYDRTNVEFHTTFI